jgi:phosphoribosyl 1,2-cyclic phosphodiesterase
MGELKVKFWGVRGSHCVPGKDTVRVGGNSTCVEVNAGGTALLFDAGAGLINCGKDLGKRFFEAAKTAVKPQLNVYLFFTHTHHDHTEGLPFFEPAYLGRTTMYLFGPRMLSQDLEVTLEHAMIPPFFPITMEDMGSQKIVQNITERNIIVIGNGSAVPLVINKYTDIVPNQPDAVRISLIKNYSHPRDGVLVYAVEYQGKKVVFATDVESYLGGDQRLIQFSRGADLLIHDAQYSAEVYANPQFPKQGWGHSTTEMAAETANKAGVKKLVLFHHDPQDTDDMVDAKEKYARTLFRDVAAAREGTEIVV